MRAHLPLTMDPRVLLALVLAGFGLVLVDTAIGAALKFRLLTGSSALHEHDLAAPAPKSAVTL